MAWQFRVTEVSGTEVRMEGEPPEPVDFDLTAIGRWRFVVEYFDSANPTVVLYSHTFVEPSAGFTTAHALAKIRAEGVQVRDTRALIAQLQTNVGQVFPLVP